MCTLIVLHRCVPSKPLVVAANRDEFLARPAEGFALRMSRTGPIVAPLDLEAGGTWVGVSANGVFAGLTNLRPHESSTEEKEASGTAPATMALGSSEAEVSSRDIVTLDRAKVEKDSLAGLALRSRGEVVMMALEAASANEAARTLSSLEEGKYNPFQLLVADGNDAWLVVYRERAQMIRLEPGPHVIGNVVDERTQAALESASISHSDSQDHSYDFDHDESHETKFTENEQPRVRKLTRVRERVEKLMVQPGPDIFEGLAGICREHVDERVDERVDEKGDGYSPFDSTCVHVADRYGTRSSLLLELSLDPRTNRLWTTDGPPCERSFENRSSLLQELGMRPWTPAATETT